MRFSNILQCFILIIFYNVMLNGLSTNGRKPGACRRLTLDNGIVRFGGKRSNRLARFECKPDYFLLGDKFAVCKDGEWDLRMPYCTKPGCEHFPILKNGMQYYTRNESIAMFFCNPGFSLKGPSVSYCNGTNWNSTLPTCTPTSNTIVLSCDFEDENLCGWINDPRHTFDWTRKNLRTPSGFIGTGPSYDHTLGKGKTGYYMYIESSSRLENDTARLLSPIYPYILSRDGCFIFYYHMYGRTTGSLRIYVHPENIDFMNILNDPDLRQKYTMFEKSGNQGNIWYRGFFNLDEMRENFQIVVEGVRGPGYISDIAIDDVSLAQSGNCAEFRNETSSTTTVPSIVKDSCINRCDKPINKTFNGEFTECQCNTDCFLQNACCVDYREFCIPTGDVSVSGTDVTDSDVTTDIGTLAPMLPTPQKAKATEIFKSNDPTYSITWKVTKTTTSKNKIQTVTVDTSTISTPKSTIKTTVQTVKSTTAVTTSAVKKIETTKVPNQTKTNNTVKTNANNKISNKTPVIIGFNNNSMYDVTKPNVTKSVEAPLYKKTVENVTTESTAKISKHYGHYGRNENGFLNDNETVESITQMQIVTTKTFTTNNTFGKLIEGTKDNEESTIKPATIGLIISSLVIIVGVISIVRFEPIRNIVKNIPNQVTELKQRWTRTRSFNSNQADMRFLVEDEELENY